MTKKNLKDMSLAELVAELKVSYGWRAELIEKLIANKK